MIHRHKARRVCFRLLNLNTTVDEVHITDLQADQLRRTQAGVQVQRYDVGEMLATAYQMIEEVSFFLFGQDAIRAGF